MWTVHSVQYVSHDACREPKMAVSLFEEFHAKNEQLKHVTTPIESQHTNKSWCIFHAALGDLSQQFI